MVWMASQGSGHEDPKCWPTFPIASAPKYDPGMRVAPCGGYHARPALAQAKSTLCCWKAAASASSRFQALYHGATGAVRYLPLEGVRLRYLGGTTNHWTGQSVPLDATDFEARSWVPDSGWPIAYEEYLRHLADARAICESPLALSTMKRWHETASLRSQTCGSSNQCFCASVRQRVLASGIAQSCGRTGTCVATCMRPALPSRWMPAAIASLR